MIKKVLLVASEFPPGPGGIGNHAYSLAKYLARRGIEVNVLADSNYAGRQEVLDFDQSLPPQIKVRRVLRIWVFTYFLRLWFLFKLVFSKKFDGAIFSGKFSLWLCAVLKTLGVKIKSLGVLHGSEVQMNNRIYRAITDWGISRLDYIVPVSHFTHSLLTPKLQRKPFKIIENGIDITEFQALNQKREVSSLKLKGDPVLLTVGNVTYRKGQHRVIKAMPEIIKRMPEVHYHVVGLPSCKAEFERLAQSLNVDQYVTFHGRLPKREDLAGAYALADCFLILSENQNDGDVEGFGIVILEANFFKVPAVGASGCGIDDAIESGFNGFLVDGNDSVEIAERVQEIINDREVFSQHAFEWAKKHDWAVIVEKYLAVFEGLDT
ncbi:glycosyltransferase family 4 protein [Marinilabilia salmonicolor]|uniref:glycosyltransferase family 4 protein n=1 Tax=Marinilabilia salmonicolor TaxID=989 RepID=UPI00029AD52E|nr:glycosyltransferase family 4 protein [Marinilabilia salmonicolor]